MTDKQIIDLMKQEWQQLGGCWGLYRKAFKCHFGVDCVDYPKTDWQRPYDIDKVFNQKFEKSMIADPPEKGDLVLFSHSGKPFSHVGFYMGHRQVLHVEIGRQPVVDRIVDLKLISKRILFIKSETLKKDGEN